MIGGLFSYNKILVGLIDFFGIWLGVMVYRHNPKGKLNRIFVAMMIIVLFRVNFALFPCLVGQNNNPLSLMFLKIAWFATFLFFVIIYHFVISFLKQERKHLFLTKTALLFGVVAALIAGFTDWVIKEIKFIDEDLIIIYGKGLAPFLGAILFLVSFTIYLLFKEYIQAPFYKKIKIEYLLTGIFIFYLANFIFNMVFPLMLGISYFYWIGDCSAIVLLVFIAYAIVRRELFGIKVILTEILEEELAQKNKNAKIFIT